MADPYTEEEIWYRREWPEPDALEPRNVDMRYERDRWLATVDALRERAEKAEARTMPTSREQVVTFLHAVAGHDATLSPPTDEMIDGVWALCKHPATTPLTLAVVAYERGRNFAAMKASAEKAERERDDWRDTSMAAVAAAHGLDWQKVTNEQIDAMEADGKAHGDKKAMDAVRRLYARWNAAVYDADKVRVERDRAEKERDEATARAERAEAELRKREAGA